MAFQHLEQIFMGLKRRLLLETLVIMRGVGCQDHWASRRMDAHGLQAPGMAGQMMHRDARCDFVFARMKDNPVTICQTHHVEHVVKLERMS